MNTVLISNEHAYAVDTAALTGVVRTQLARMSLDACQVEIAIVDEAKITELNETALEHEGATDVLSFPLYESVAEIRSMLAQLPDGVHLPIGDIVASYPRAVSDATSAGGSIQRQLEFYVRHSTLHLLGFHHE